MPADVSPLTAASFIGSLLTSGLGLGLDWWSGQQAKKAMAPGNLPFDVSADDANAQTSISALSADTANPGLTSDLLTQSLQYGGAPGIAQEQENQRVARKQQAGIDDILTNIDSSRFSDIVKRADELSQTPGISQGEVDMMVSKVRNEANAATANSIDQARSRAGARGLSADTLQAIQSSLSNEGLMGVTQADLEANLAAKKFNREWTRNTLSDAADYSRQLLGMQLPLETARVGLEQPLDILSITDPATAREINRIMMDYGVDAQTANTLLQVGGSGLGLTMNQIQTDRTLDQQRRQANQANWFGLGSSLIGGGSSMGAAALMPTPTTNYFSMGTP